MNEQQTCRVLVIGDAQELRRHLNGTVAPDSLVFEVDEFPRNADSLAHCREARAAGRPYSIIFHESGPQASVKLGATLEALWAEDPRLEVVICADPSDPPPEEIARQLPHGSHWLLLKKPYLPGEALQTATLLARAHSQTTAAQKTRRAAHDFNNLLTVISGHIGLLTAEKPASSKAADSLKEMAAATKRASVLMRQLLTLGRKQKLQPPVAELDDAAIPAGEQRDIGGAETILLVEDEPPLLKLMHHILASHGYKVHDSTTGKAALEIWQQHKLEIDLVLTDLVLPGGMTGFDLVKILRSEKPALKVIYISGYDANHISEGGMPASDANFLQKPFHTRKLAETVFDVLRRK